MGRLRADFTPAFARDLKRLARRHVDDAPLAEVIELILDNSLESHARLRQRHRMHTLNAAWQAATSATSPIPVTGC